MRRLGVYMKTVFYFGLVILVGCASKSDRVTLERPEELNQTLSSSTSDRSEKIGVRGDNIVIQKRVTLEENLTKTQDAIEEMERNIYGASRRNPGGLWKKLQECRGQIADPRLGGSGKAEPMEKWEKISESDPDFKYRVDASNQVVAVSEEQLETRVLNLQKQKSILERRFAEFQTKSDECDESLKVALVKSGLNPSDAKALGEWVKGPEGYKVWKIKRPATNDPEEMMRRKENRDKD